MVARSSVHRRHRDRHILIHLIDVRRQWIVVLLQVRDGQIWCEGEPMLVKNHMPKLNDMTSLEVHAPITAMVGGILEEDTHDQTMGEFVRHDTSQTYL
jgi:hypothetical protein